MAAEASDETVNVFGHALDRLWLRGAYGRRDDVDDHKLPLPALQSTRACIRDSIEHHLSLVDADGSFDRWGVFFSGRRRRKLRLRIAVWRFSGTIDQQFWDRSQGSDVCQRCPPQRPVASVSDGQDQI